MIDQKINDINWKYESAVNELEAIIAQIEAGDLPLEELFNQFEIAVEHLHSCESFLRQGKEKMDLLIETLNQEIDDSI